MGRAIDVNSHEMYVNENTIQKMINDISSAQSSRGLVVCVNDDNACDIRDQIRRLCSHNGIASSNYDLRWTGDCCFKFNFYDGGILYIANRKQNFVRSLLEYTQDESRLYDNVLIGWQTNYDESRSYGIGLAKAYQLLKTPMVDISEEELNDISDLFG